jgi:heptosyltransferase-2
MKRILVIRGGAIGDFVLILPALAALRKANPDAHIEILGYKHIAELVNNRFYANSIRSIEYGPLSRFFARDGDLASDLKDYFASFDPVISYLYDPDKIFENNVRRCGVRQFVVGPARISEREHASRQLALPLETLGIKVENWTARFFASPEDRLFARDFLRDWPRPIVAFHPGSGSEKKNWPLQNWIELGNDLLSSDNFSGSILLVGGEADETKMARLGALWNSPRVRSAENLELSHLGAVLEDTIFVGHDSGISHIAAAAGAKCILLFGPTNAETWAPTAENVRVIQAPRSNLEDLSVRTVRAAISL